MISKATARYIRISPRKTRQVISLVKGKNPRKGLAILANTNKRTARCVAKVLKSAIANLGERQDIKQEDLYISRIIVDGGPTMKRFRPRAMGRATPVLKRTSHITVELDSKAPKLKPVPPKSKAKTKPDKKSEKDKKSKKDKKSRKGKKSGKD